MSINDNSIKGTRINMTSHIRLCLIIFIIINVKFIKNKLIAYVFEQIVITIIYNDISYKFN